jgi:putative RecB family exonuclease
METSTEGVAGAAGDEGTAAGPTAAATVEAGTVGVVERVAIAPASLSPSRASDFMQCPLLYRFRVIDRLPEKPSEAATRGTLVHSVLERLFDAPAAERTAPRAKSLIPGQWDRLRESRPEVVELFADDPEGERLTRWLGEAERLVERWFSLEDPTRLEPAEREMFVEAELASGLKLRGIIDRVDVAPTGDVRIVDYKTGKAPRPEYAEGALFQMKFYALVVWRLKQVVPRRLQLVYLGSGDVVTYDPVLADLERVERKLLALWEAIRLATETGEWRPRPTKLCGWCDHQSVCPEFGGTPPPYPLPVRVADGVSAEGVGVGVGVPAGGAEARDGVSAGGAEARDGVPARDAGAGHGVPAGDAGASDGVSARESVAADDLSARRSEATG